MSETRILADYLTCVYEPRNGRKVKRKGKCIVIFGKCAGASNTNQETFFLRLCKNENEHEDYSFTADQFCGIEVGCPEQSKKNPLIRFFKKKYTFLKVILREQTITFRVEWDVETPFLAFRTIEEWRKKIIKELDYKCSWTVYVPGSRVLGEGYGKLHLTGLRLSLTTTDSTWECLASWRLKDLRQCNETDGELVLDFQGTAEKLRFLTEQAKEIVRSLVDYMAKHTVESFSTDKTNVITPSNASPTLFPRKRQSVHRNSGLPATRERSASENSIGLVEGPCYVPSSLPPCYNCLSQPCTCDYQESNHSSCALKPNSPLAHSKTLLPIEKLMNKRDGSRSGATEAKDIYDEPLPYIPGTSPGKVHRPEYHRRRKSLPKEEPVHEPAELTNRLARLARNDKPINKYINPEEVRQNKLKLEIPNGKPSSRPLPEIPKENGEYSPAGPAEVSPKTPIRPPRTPVESKIGNPVGDVKPQISPPLGSPKVKRKKPIPSPRHTKLSDGTSIPATPTIWQEYSPGKERKFRLLPVPAPRKALRHQRSRSWDSSMKPSTLIMNGGGLVDPIATMPRRVRWTNDSSSSDEEEDDIYNINKLLRPGMDCCKRQSIQWYMNAVGLNGNRHSDSPPPVPSREDRKPLNIDMEPEYESARCVYNTLEMVLQRKPPFPDTLKLTPNVRNKVCLHLYLGNVTLLDWKDLASAIGLEYAAIEMIASFQVHHPNHHTAAEIVLRHWQYMYNRYKNNREKCRYECTQEKLIEILTKMNRLDVVEVITKAKVRR